MVSEVDMDLSSIPLDVPALVACAFTMLLVALSLYTADRRVSASEERARELELRLTAELRRAAAERAGGVVTLEEQIQAAREAAAAAEEQAGVARIYAMEAADSAAEIRATDPGEPPISGLSNVVTLRPVQ
jgi:hypothetical protein